jgi:ribonuclease-3 family protein
MDQHSGLTLAYLGDSLLEVEVRKYLIGKGFTKVGELHQQAIRFTAATGQSKVALRWLESDLLTELEVSVFKRGRNAISGRKPKNTDLADYHRATGIEALFGFLFLNEDHDRLEELIKAYIQTIEESAV